MHREAPTPGLLASIVQKVDNANGYRINHYPADKRMHENIRSTRKYIRDAKCN